MNENVCSICKSVRLGVTGALLASLCCVTPLFIVFFGIGSVSFALGFTKYKPFFFALAVVFVFLAIIVHIRKKGTTCSIHPDELRRKKVFIAGTLFFMAVFYFLMQYVVLPFLGKFVYVS